MKEGPLVLTRTFPVLAPNKIVAAVGRIDQRLNPVLDVSLRSRLRSLRMEVDGTFTLDNNAAGTFDDRTLLFVHGTFSNGKSMLEEFKATKAGLSFLKAAMGGAKP